MPVSLIKALPQGKEIVFVAGHPAISFADEMPDVLQHVLLPMIVGFVLSSVAIYAWSRRTTRQVRLLSPLATSTMIGMLSYVVADLYVSVGSVRGVGRALGATLLWGAVTAPTLFVIGPIFFLYVFRTTHDGRPIISDNFVFATCFLCLVVQLLWFYYGLAS